MSGDMLAYKMYLNRGHSPKEADWLAGKGPLTPKKKKKKRKSSEFITAKMLAYARAKRAKAKQRHPVSERQRRWAFVAEERGELPRGKAREWSRRVKGESLKSMDMGDPDALREVMAKAGARGGKYIKREFHGGRWHYTYATQYTGRRAKLSPHHHNKITAEVAKTGTTYKPEGFRDHDHWEKSLRDAAEAIASGKRSEAAVAKVIGIPADVTGDYVLAELEEMGVAESQENKAGKWTWRITRGGFGKSLSKAAARGGKYYKRTPKSGGGWKYYYSKTAYDRAHGDKAHVSGPDTADENRRAKAKKIITAVLSRDGSVHEARQQVMALGYSKEQASATVLAVRESMQAKGEHKPSVPSQKQETKPVEAAAHKEERERGRWVIRPTTYRRKEGFSLRGPRTSIFVRKRETAEKLRAAYKGGASHEQIDAIIRDEEETKPSAFEQVQEKLRQQPRTSVAAGNAAEAAKQLLQQYGPKEAAKRLRKQFKTSPANAKMLIQLVQTETKKSEGPMLRELRKAAKGVAKGGKYLSRRPDGHGSWIYNYGHGDQHKAGHEKVKVGKKAAFRIALRDDKSEEVKGEHHGDFAMHRHKGYGGMQYSVTHKPTGMSVASSSHRGEALALLHHHGSNETKFSEADLEDKDKRQAMRSHDSSFGHEMDHPDAYDWRHHEHKNYRGTVGGPKEEKPKAEPKPKAEAKEEPGVPPAEAGKPKHKEGETLSIKGIPFRIKSVSVEKVGFGTRKVERITVVTKTGRELLVNYYPDGSYRTNIGEAMTGRRITQRAGEAKQPIKHIEGPAKGSQTSFDLSDKSLGGKVHVIDALDTLDVLHKAQRRAS